MKKRRFIFAIAIPTIAGFTTIASVSCSQELITKKANEALSNIIRGFSNKTINTKKFTSIMEFSSVIDKLQNQNQTEITKNLSEILDNTFATALGDLAKIESATIVEEGSLVFLQLKLSYPNSSNVQEVKIEIGNIINDLNPNLNLDEIATKLNNKIFSPKTTVVQKSPQEYEKWIKSVSIAALTDSLTSELESSFKINLGQAKIIKAQAITPKNNDETEIVLELVLTNGLVNKNVKITLSPLISQNILDKKADPSVIIEIYDRLNTLVLVSENEFNKRANEAVNELLFAQDLKGFISVFDVTNFLPKYESIFSTNDEETIPSIPEGYELRAVLENQAD
ncbi:hypothetical protein EI74_0391 [Mycoplasma testudineum]|uniref:Lipoprotein n=1 Tax=Mycoplasma testudineum TaxID=244584 RepID=A0A4R6IHH3_9MOLU|nr:hypothetical protein [Mycoplasma testudineum]OYD27007.1 hypothetical protein CG473_01580 [Mycoplasma testudineum]TDO20555.1 hypothetical protein EI74_0391 [Mycoplasma testudineum]